MDIAAIEKSVMTTTDEKLLKQMAENMPFDIYQQLGPEARRRLAHYAGGGFRPPLKEAPKVKSRVIAPPRFHAHRKLTEKERDRMIHLWASAPASYQPDVDDELMKLGLVRWYDVRAVENTEVPFYDSSGRILPEWYDFKQGVVRESTGSEIKLIEAKRLADGNIEITFKLGRYKHQGVYSPKEEAFWIDRSLNLTRFDYEQLKEQIKEWMYKIQNPVSLGR